MRRRTSLRTSGRTSVLPVPADRAWAVVASGRSGPQWYVDAGPFVFRDVVDRFLGGGARRGSPPGRDLLVPGDRVGFWDVTRVDPDELRLALLARVRAPGAVTCEVQVQPEADDACRLTSIVRFVPSGLLGRAYLVTDLAAREAVVELAHRKIMRDVTGS